jgi:hypothetical protein
MIYHPLLTPFPTPKKERGTERREREREKKGNIRKTRISEELLPLPH